MVAKIEWRKQHPRFFVALALIVIAPVTVAPAQDVEVSLGRINSPTVGHRFITFPQVQVGLQVASFTRENHPLRLAAHWGTWKTNTGAEDVLCAFPCPAPRPLGRTHVVGVRAVQTTSAGRLQPQLVVGFGYRFSPYYEHLPYIEAGLNAGVLLSPTIMTVVGLARYHPLVSPDDPNIRQLALRLGLAIGSFR